MKRIRHLGLGVVMALALTGVLGASSASASNFSFDEYPAFANASPVKGEFNGFEFSGGRVAECPPSPFAATAAFAPTETLTPASMADAKCNTYEGAATLKMNGCKLIYHTGAETEPGSFGGTVDIGPSGCGPMVLDGPTCNRLFPSQAGLAASYENQGEGPESSVRIDLNAIVQYTAEGPTFLCGSGVQSGNYLASWELGAMNEGGEKIGVSVKAVGLFLAGKESKEEASQPRVEAEQYPLTVGGEQDPADVHVLTFAGGRKVECDEVNSSGAATGATSELSLGVKYVGCEGTILSQPGFPSTIAMNGCQQLIDVLNAGPPYAGSLGIGCSKGGETIDVMVYLDSKAQAEGKPFCTWKISAQSGLGGIGLANFGSGSDRGIAADLAVKGIAYTRTQGTLANCGGVSSTASYAGGTTLRGLL